MAPSDLPPIEPESITFSERMNSWFNRILQPGNLPTYKEAPGGDGSISPEVMNALTGVPSTVVRISEQTDSRLTDIMMAQDFHDLTGQVINRVVQLASTIEEQLLGLLLQSAPSGQPGHDQAFELAGPVVNPEGRTDVVSDQAQVDDLLASLGF